MIIPEITNATIDAIFGNLSNVCIVEPFFGLVAHIPLVRCWKR
jgi:hypothetical protein